MKALIGRRRQWLTLALVATLTVGYLTYEQGAEEAPAASAVPSISLSTVAPAASSSPAPETFSSHNCPFEQFGTWLIPSNSTPPSAQLPTWIPPSPDALLRSPAVGSRRRQCHFRHFSQADAIRCLQGKLVLFYGNSNTRTLYTALESLLKNQPQLSRLAAKQQCDNSKTNHSCWMTIYPNETAVVEVRASAGFERAEEDVELLRLHKPIRLYYWGYTKDLYDPSLRAKMGSQQEDADLVITNSQLNVIQATPSTADLISGHRQGMTQFLQFAAAFKRSKARANRDPDAGPSFYWHTTTYVCPNQPHFKRYRYQKRYWSNRSPHQTNEAIRESNTYIAAHLDPHVVGVVDGAAMVSSILGDSADRSAPSASLCRYYDDPLHHRFLDAYIVQVLLNRYCPGSG